MSRIESLEKPLRLLLQVQTVILKRLQRVMSRKQWQRSIELRTKLSKMFKMQNLSQVKMLLFNRIQLKLSNQRLKL